MGNVPFGNVPSGNVLTWAMFPLAILPVAIFPVAIFRAQNTSYIFFNSPPYPQIKKNMQKITPEA